MRTELLNELENEYAALRFENEKKEAERRELIRSRYPKIDQLTRERDELIHGTIRGILSGEATGDALTERMHEINRQIKGALIRAGLPDNYLEPIYRCPVCRDRGYTENPLKEPCRCLKEAYQKKLRAAIGLNSMAGETFENFNADRIPDEPLAGDSLSQRKYAVFARNKCEKWANEYPNVSARDILLTGDSGLGKTFLMHAIATRLIERGYQVLMISAYQMLQIARKSYFEADDSMDELMRVPVLMIDDLGSEPLMKNITIEQLFNLINERQNHNLSTVISSNMNIEGLQIRYNERITSRLSDPGRCMMLMLQGKDLRKISG